MRLPDAQQKILFCFDSFSVSYFLSTSMIPIVLIGPVR